MTSGQKITATDLYEKYGEELFAEGITALEVRRQEMDRENQPISVATAEERIPNVRTKEGYQEYLKTSHWKFVREFMKSVCNNRCQLCGHKKEVVHVHHNNYENLWEEREIDLIVLCPECHHIYHKEELS